MPVTAHTPSTLGQWLFVWRRADFVTYFSLAALNIVSLCLVFISLISMCLVFLCGFILYETLWASWIWVLIYFSFVREVFNYNLLKYFLMLFLSLFFWDVYNSNIGALNIVPEVSETVFISFQSFSNSAMLQVFPPFYIPAHLSGIFCLFVCICYSAIGSL